MCAQSKPRLTPCSDVLPWQSHVRYGEECKDALFIDIDYPDLMQKKRGIVLETPQLKELLGPDFETSKSKEDFVLLKSETYCQIGCDLRELDALRKVLETLVDLSDCSVLFVAEVSVTYMDTESADNLLRWAKSVGKAEFCLLEQLLPYGAGHPFAQTMLKHFDKLKTPPRSVGQYPTVDDQRDRFISRGWSSVRIWDLWEAWCCGEFVSAEERVALDDVEPFDEWEEFMLFCRHYFVLHASATEDLEAISGVTRRQPKADIGPQELDMTLSTVTGASKRRFGASAAIQDAEGQDFGLHMMGLGSNAREDSYDIYSLDGAAVAPVLPVTGPSPRVCFTVTDLGSYGILLIGGRASPASAFSDCWILSKDQERSWRSTHKLPVPLYRHASMKLAGTALVLVAGGKTGPSQISEDYYVFHAEKGWLQCKTAGDVPKPVFGSVLCSNPAAGGEKAPFSGLLIGGIEKTGLVVEEKYEWALDMTSPQASNLTTYGYIAKLTMKQPTITFKLINTKLIPELSIFGANTVDVNGGSLIFGGMGADYTVDGQGVSWLSAKDSQLVSGTIHQNPSDAASKPFMIGSTVLQRDNDIIIAGGGATCFSMGTYWDTNTYQATIPEDLRADKTASTNGSAKPTEVKFISSHRVVSSISAQKGDMGEPGRSDAKARISTIPRISLSSASEFETILRRGQPVVIENLALGSCLQDWTAKYMADKVGSDKQVRQAGSMIPAVSNSQLGCCA